MHDASVMRLREGMPPEQVSSQSTAAAAGRAGPAASTQQGVATGSVTGGWEGLRGRFREVFGGSGGQAA